MHCAAQPSHDYGKNFPIIDFNINATGTLNLLEVTKSICKGLGLPFSHGSMGGGSDGNFSGALGVSTIDGLGTLGDGYHTLNEHLYIDSIAKRANVIANIIKQLK